MMPNPGIHIDQDALRRAVAPGIANLERRLTETMRDTVRQVNSEMAGQPMPEVFRVLRERLVAAVPGVTWDDEKIAEFAEAISERTLTE